MVVGRRRGMASGTRLVSGGLLMKLPPLQQSPTEPPSQLWPYPDRRSLLAGRLIVYQGASRIVPDLPQRQKAWELLIKSSFTFATSSLYNTVVHNGKSNGKKKKKKNQEKKTPLMI